MMSVAAHRLLRFVVSVLTSSLLPKADCVSDALRVAESSPCRPGAFRRQVSMKENSQSPTHELAILHSHSLHKCHRHRVLSETRCVARQARKQAENRQLPNPLSG